MEISSLSCNLPGDVMIDILSGLSVRSLLKFRCVCKSWNTLTRDPIFARKQHSKVASSSSSSTTEDNTHLILVHGHLYDDPQVSVLCKKAALPVKSAFRNDILRWVQLYGPCNGIVCIYHYRIARFALWNPVTREMKAVPDLICYSAFFDAKIGFGYDPVSDDYKILRIAEACIQNDHPSISEGKYKGFKVHSSEWWCYIQQVHVYSLNKNTWKFVQTYEKLNMTSSSSSWKPKQSFFAAYVKGFCYRLVGTKRGKDYSITSFNMTSEKFNENEILVPEEVYDKCNMIDEVQLVEVKGKLCLAWQEPCLLNLRVLVNKRWIKHKAISLHFDKNYGSLRYDLLMIRPNGDIILRDKANMLKLYEASTRKMKYLSFDISSSIDQIIYCNASLVPLYGRLPQVL